MRKRTTLGLIFLLSALWLCACGRQEAAPVDGLNGQEDPARSTELMEPSESAVIDGEAVTQVGAVTRDGLPLRAAGSADSQILCELEKDTVVSVMGGDRGWLKVRCGSLMGYVAEGYVAARDSATDLHLYGRVIDGGLRLRRAPDGDVIRTLEQGVYVEITGFERGFYAVTHEGVSGYMSAQYLAPEMTMPTEHTTPDPTAPKRTWIYKYYIKVNVQTNTVTVYEPDASDYFTVPVRAMICSTGEHTPQSGVFDPPGQNGVVTAWLSLEGGVYGQYATHITGDILFHSVPYLTYGDKGSLEYWEFDKLGTSASLGCVRLQVSDAKWIYDNAKQGNIQGVEFYASSIPGPLGQPAAPKISNNEACRNWDPTDPDTENPWR